jgi:hypothetical protein
MQLNSTYSLYLYVMMYDSHTIQHLQLPRNKMGKSKLWIYPPSAINSSYTLPLPLPLSVPVPKPRLRHISIRPVVLALQKLLLNQALDIPLNPTDLERTPIARRLDRLGDELSVPDALARLEDAHDRRLRLVVPVGRDALVRLLVLGGRFLELDRVDFDAVFGVGERRVEREGVGRRNVAALGVLAEGPDLGACEGLEGAVEFGGGWGGS